jgi:hypothetical protein
MIYFCDYMSYYVFLQHEKLMKKLLDELDEITRKIKEMQRLLNAEKEEYLKMGNSCQNSVHECGVVLTELSGDQKPTSSIETIDDNLVLYSVDYFIEEIGKLVEKMKQQERTLEEWRGVLNKEFEKDLFSKNI